MSVLKTHPAVFAVGNSYQIMVPVSQETLRWVEVDGNCYYDDSNGIIRSRTSIHRMTVPVDTLNHAGKYTVCYREVIERKPYFSETSEIIKVNYDFFPVKPGKTLAYEIADAHNLVNEPVACAKFFEQNYGKIDFLILNGDIPNHSGDIKYFDAIYEIASAITEGTRPVIFSRGNHDTRGIYAENIADYTPTDFGNSYYTFKLGDIWGIVLDCGEDKLDSHPEYGTTICCHEFRKRETCFLKNLINTPEASYMANDVSRRLVVCHIPFTRRFQEPFNIEEETYAEWSHILRTHIHPDLMICGHTHILSIDMPGGDMDALGQPCPVIVGSRGTKDFAGAGFVFSNDTVTVVFNTVESIISEQELQLKNSKVRISL